MRRRSASRARLSMPRCAGLSPTCRCPISSSRAGRKSRRRASRNSCRRRPQYLKETPFDRLAAHGRKLAAQHRDTLARIEREFGVPGNVVLAIWGARDRLRPLQLPHNAIRVLATQAYLGRRKDLFRDEFLLRAEDAAGRRAARATCARPGAARWA